MIVVQLKKSVFNIFSYLQIQNPKLISYTNKLNLHLQICLHHHIYSECDHQLQNKESQNI